MAGRAGLPTSARRILINFDSCAGGLQGTADTVIGFGGPTFEPSKTQRISTGIDCDFDNNSVPTRWLSRQLWVPLEPNQALVLWFFSFSGTGSTSMRYRLQLLGWVP